MNERKNVTTQVLLTVQLGRDKKWERFKSFRGELNFSMGDTVIVCNVPERIPLALKGEIASKASWYLDNKNAQTKCYRALVVVSEETFDHSMEQVLEKAGWRIDGKA